MIIKDVSGENGDSIFRAQGVQEWRQMTSPSRIHIAYFAHKRENSNSQGVTEVAFILTAGRSYEVKQNADRQVAPGD